MGDGRWETGLDGGAGAARWKGKEKADSGSKPCGMAESYEPKTAGPGIGAWLRLYLRDLERKEPGLGEVWTGGCEPWGRGCRCGGVELD